MSKQFNIKDNNGFYLTYKPNEEIGFDNYENLLIENYDFFPITQAESERFNYVNSAYSHPESFIGSNSLEKSNSTATDSKIILKNELIRGKEYYSNFFLYFRFINSANLSTNNPLQFTYDGLTNTETVNFLNRIRLKFFLVLGTNEIPLEFEANIQRYKPSTSVWANINIITDRTGNVTNGAYGIQESVVDGIQCVDMAYTDSNSTIKGFFDDDYKLTPGGYNFRVKLRTPEFIEKAKITKDLKIIVKYYNLKVSGTKYNEAEMVELMSNTFTHYEPISGTELFERKLIKQPIVDFLIKSEDFYINTHGVSVTEQSKSFTALADGRFYVLNKNSQSIYFNGIYLNSIRFRNDNINSTRSIGIYLDKTTTDDTYVYDEYFVTFKSNIIGKIKISRLLRFTNQSNELIYPFQSIRFGATYMVYNLNQLDVQYFGASNIRANKKIGTFDINFTVLFYTDKELTNSITDNITITINAVNTGYVPRAIQPPSEDNIILNPPLQPSGTFD